MDRIWHVWEVTRLGTHGEWRMQTGDVQLAGACACPLLGRLTQGGPLSNAPGAPCHRAGQEAPRLSAQHWGTRLSAPVPLLCYMVSHINAE